MTLTPETVCAAVLAGGLGTRLRPAVGDTPKVLAPVGGRPFLALLLDRLAAGGFRECVLLVGHGADRVRAAFGDRHGPVRLVYSAEPEPLGTGGAVRYALPHLTGRPLLLLNGDSYCDADLPRLLAFHAVHGRRVTLCVTQVPDAGRFGRVAYDADGTVIRFEEKEASGRPGWINAGVYLFSPDVMADIPPGRPVSLEREVLPGLVAAGEVRGFPGDRFIDIGVPESYRSAAAFLGVGGPAALTPAEQVG